MNKTENSGLVGVKYIGFRESWVDRLYGTGLYFTQEQVRHVPMLAAVKLLRHADLFERVDIEALQQDDAEALQQEAAAKQQREDEDLDETFDTYLSIDQMDKDALELFAKSNYEQDLDKRKNVETLRAQVKGMIDQFGIVK